MTFDDYMKNITPAAIKRAQEESALVIVKTPTKPIPSAKSRVLLASPPKFICSVTGEPCTCGHKIKGCTNKE